MEVFKEPDILDGWWISSDLHSLERRAILSKEWICVTHRSRFIKPGDYISFEMAGFPILMILGKDKIVRAFHNVCRHRAYTITKKTAGSSLVLGCRYHGWSYNSRGDLIKAPHFDGIEGFKKSENGLFKIRTCSDRGGYIYVNLDTGSDAVAPDCRLAISFATRNSISLPDCKWVASWEMEGNFNWKVCRASESEDIGDATALAPPISNITSIANRLVSLFSSRTTSASRPTNLDNVETVHMPPTTTLFNLSATPFWAMLTVSPTSAIQSIVSVSIFTNTQSEEAHTDPEALRPYFTKYIRSLEERYISLVESSTPPQSLPEMSNFPYISQLKAHLEVERAAGRPIYPASRCDVSGRSKASCRAEKVSRDLESLPRSSHSLPSKSNTAILTTNATAIRPSKSRIDSVVDLSSSTARETDGSDPLEW